LLCIGRKQKKRPPGRFDLTKEAAESPPSPQWVFDQFDFFNSLFLYSLFASSNENK